MSTVETIPVSVDQWPEPPRFLVEWSSPWEEFKTAIQPALSKPPKQLAGEAPIGMFPYRGMLMTWGLEVLLIILLLLFGGGGFYVGGPLVGGGLGTLILIVLIVMVVTGRV